MNVLPRRQRSTQAKISSRRAVALVLAAGLAVICLDGPGMANDVVIAIESPSATTSDPAHRLLTFPQVRHHRTTRSFSAWQLMPGIAVAALYPFTQGDTTRLRRHGDWPPPLPREAQQRALDQIASLLREIASTRTGRVLLDTVARLRPIPMGTNEWRLAGEHGDRGASDISVVLFPSEDSAYRPLDARHATNFLGTSGAIEYSSTNVDVWYDDAGTLRGTRPALALSHELIHHAHALAGADARHLPVNLHSLTFAGAVPAGRANPPHALTVHGTNVEEALTRGSAYDELQLRMQWGGRSFVAGHAMPGVFDSATASNAFLVAATDPAVIDSARRRLRASRFADSGDILRLELRQALARENPTETSLAREAGWQVRPRYLSNTYADSGLPSIYKTRAAVSHADLTAADFEAPDMSLRLAPSATGEC